MSANLSTQYLGLPLRNPLVVAACPLTREAYQLERLEQAGAAALVIYSLFAEQIQNDALRSFHEDAAGGALSAAEPLPSDYVVGLDTYLQNIELAKKSVDVPIIASLNGSGLGDWIRFAPLMESAGADALELNIYFVPTDPDITGEQVEARYLELVAAVRETIRIPLSIKLGPFFSSLPNFARSLAAAGADGLVLFNRFLQPDIDVTTFEVTPRLVLSTRDELRLPLRWIAILRSQLSVSLAASSGTHTGEDAAKLLLAGADVVTMASALLKFGPEHLTTVLQELTAYLDAKGFATVDDMRGTLAPRHQESSTAFERANYIKTLMSYDEEPPE